MFDSRTTAKQPAKEKKKLTTTSAVQMREKKSSSQIASQAANIVECSVYFISFSAFLPLFFVVFKANAYDLLYCIYYNNFRE